jgi:hypothetical protein
MKHKRVRTFEPTAVMFHNAVGYFGYANDSSRQKLRMMEAVLITCITIDVQGGVN